MTEQAPPQEIVFFAQPTLMKKLKHWRPELDVTQLQLIESRAVVWNDGSLGCPMPGKHYTQALVPGHLFRYFHMGEIIEVHSNSSMTLFAIPGHGYL